MIMALAGVPIVALSLTSAEVARAFGWLWLAWAPLQIAQPPLLLLMIAVAMLIVGDLSATVALGVGILAHATVLVVQWGILRARIASKISVEPSMDVRLWVHVALPFVWITAATLVLAQGGVIIIGFFVTPADVATYKIAAATSLLVGILLQASTALSAPKFASLHAQTRSSDLEVLFTSVIRWTFWPSLAIAFMLIAFRSPILRLFGLDSDNARWVLSILALGQLANTTAGPVTHLLAMTGHQLLTARVTGCSAVLYLLLALVATALWGTIGAALALVAASLFWNFWLAVLVVRKLKFHPGTFLQRYRQSER
jgi:O-antigen/teichoic acid export membrane protein